ncbi:hypothetical protein D1007_49150 [Hordeum vulgare]|nr:hypothetical protein D1007_49150 [Hordeum vulgare]
MTTPTGGVAPAPSRAAAVGSKKGKTSGKKKAADGSGSSKTKKKLAGRRTGAASTEAPASSLVEPAADAHHVFDEMPPSLNYDAYMSTIPTPSDAMAAMGGMSFASLMGGMGAPPPVMGGMDAPPAAVEDLANTVGASHDAVHDEVREEDSSTEAEESSSEDEDEDEEDDE